jgi:hypothetical protein
MPICLRFVDSHVGVLRFSQRCDLHQEIMPVYHISCSGLVVDCYNSFAGIFILCCTLCLFACNEIVFCSQLLLRRYHTSLSTLHVCGSSADHCDYAPCPRNLVDSVASPVASPRAEASAAAIAAGTAAPAHDGIPHELVEPAEQQLHERHLRTCASCRMARYCSRSCQVCMLVIESECTHCTVQTRNHKNNRECLPHGISLSRSWLVQAADWAQHRIVCASFLRANKEAEELEAQQQQFHAQATVASGVSAIPLPPAHGHRLLAPIVPDLARCTRYFKCLCFV